MTLINGKEIKFISKKHKQEHSLDFSKTGKVYYEFTNDFYTLDNKKYPTIVTFKVPTEIEQAFTKFNLDFISIDRKDHVDHEYYGSGSDQYGRSIHIWSIHNKEFKDQVDSFRNKKLEVEHAKYDEYALLPRSYFKYIDGLCYPVLESDSWQHRKSIIYSCSTKEHGGVRVYNHNNQIHYYLEPVSYHEIESGVSYIYGSKHDFREWNDKRVLYDMFSEELEEPMNFIKIQTWSESKVTASNEFFSYQLLKTTSKSKTLRIFINDTLQTYMDNELHYNIGDKVENLYKIVKRIK